MITILREIQTGCKCRHCGTAFLYDKEDVNSNVKVYGVSTLGVKCPVCKEKLSMLLGKDVDCFFRINTNFEVFKQKWWEKLFTITFRF